MNPIHCLEEVVSGGISPLKIRPFVIEGGEQSKAHYVLFTPRS